MLSVLPLAYTQPRNHSDTHLLTERNLNRRRYGDLFNKLAEHVSRLKSLRFLRVDAVFTRFLYEPQKILADDTLHSFAKHSCLQHVQFGRSDVHELVQLAKKMHSEAVDIKSTCRHAQKRKVRVRRGKEKSENLPWFGNYILREHEKGVEELASALAAKTHP